MEFDVSKLNDAQKRAMEDTEGAVLVLAGAGSGKTRVLTHRVAYLVLEKKVSPYNILAITFTNKAAGEMKERLNTLLGEGNNVWISTFHSLCYTILRRNGDKLGYNSNFSIYDESDSARTVRKALKDLNLDGSAIKDSALKYIGEAKNKGLSPEEYYNDIKGVAKYDKEIYEIYKRYEELLKANNAMDFDDLLHKTKELFSSFPDVLEEYKRRFRYIHVDEFQDTNGVQFDIVKMLAGRDGNLFVVGDDDQSIYGWRGAEVRNIIDFDKTYPNAKIHKLLENYRSTGKILDAANKVIKNNVGRHEKELFTKKGDGVRVEYYTAYSDYDEADWVVDTIISLKRYYGYSNKDFAILVRANSLSRLFESRLASVRLRYRVLGGFRFFDRKEIQDVIAYLRAVSNMRDGEAIERIINVPRRGIGDTTVEKLSDYARRTMTDLISVIVNIGTNGVLTGASAKKVEDFRNIMADLYVNSKKMPMDKFAEYLVKRAGFEQSYNEEKNEENMTRWENILEFLRYVKEYCGNNPEATLDGFLQTVALAPENKDEEQDNDTVFVATMHAVKGLEFKVVFIVACEEDVFPSAQSKKDSNIEEERRVMYVAVTRARERLYISNAQNRYRFNQKQANMPSRFIAESKGEKVQSSYDIYEEKRAYNESRGAYGGFNRGKDYYSGEREIVTPMAKPYGNAAPPQKPQGTPPPVLNKDLSQFAGGVKVSHPVYGAGTILIVAGSGDDANATVMFPSLGIKKFKLALAPLKVVKD